MGELFATTPENVLMHLKNIYQEGELVENAINNDCLVVQQEARIFAARSIEQGVLEQAVRAAGNEAASR